MKKLVSRAILVATLVIVSFPIATTAQQPPQPLDEFVPISQLPPQDQLPAAPLLVTAYAFVWVALFLYVVSVARRLGKVQHEVERLESDMKKGTRS
jgi:CcmD family protein